MRLYQLKIQLCDSKPPIWRQVLVPEAITFNELHDVIQAVMPWEDSHLHRFAILPPLRNGNVTRNAHINSRSLSGDDDYDLDVDVMLRKQRKAESRRLCDEAKPGSHILYTYDMGDSWEHLITVEKSVEPQADERYPLCVKAKGACPPEDCGGIWGYYDLLDVLADPKHREHKSMLEWLGLESAEEFDPEQVDLAQANARLKPLQRKKKAA